MIGRHVLLEEGEEELAVAWVLEQGVRCLDVLQQVCEGELVLLGDGGSFAQEVLPC